MLELFLFSVFGYYTFQLAINYLKDRQIKYKWYSVLKLVSGLSTTRYSIQVKVPHGYFFPFCWFNSKSNEILTYTLFSEKMNFIPNQTFFSAHLPNGQGSRQTELTSWEILFVSSASITNILAASCKKNRKPVRP